MLARVTSGQSGIVEYLKEGVKSGRELNRDELDHRVCIDGNIAITDSIIKELNQEGRKENYLHITLSFGERDLSEQKIVEAYRDYKRSIMSAYSVDEYNVYAEIHYPKIKSYRDKKTGELVERLPHVHMVLPQKNLVSDKALKPFGLYSSNIKFHDAIQESVNRKHQLESPYDNQRKYRMSDNSEFISRYKGDNFKGSNGDLKNELFELIESKNIRSMAEFKKELGKYGEVSTGKAGAVDEYLKLKVQGADKNIRLKETAFKKPYIENRELLREKPSDKEVSKNLKHWVDIRSHEMKHIHSASPKVRKEYYALTDDKKEEYLHDRRNDFARRYDTSDSRVRADYIRPSGRKEYREHGITRIGERSFTQVSNGLPSMPERSLVRANNRQSKTSESVLPSNEHNNLESRGTDRDNKLRWSTSGSRGKRGLAPKNDSLSEQYLSEHQAKTSPQEIQKFREIRKRLDPYRVLNHFEKTHGLIKSNYEVHKAKDGSPRIKIGNRSFNVSDFSTQHMRQDWESTKGVLTALYKKQLKAEHKDIDISVIGLKGIKRLENGLPYKNLMTTKKQKQIEKREEKYALNSIVFVSNYVTQRHVSQSVEQRLNHSVRTLKHLQQQELYGERKMALSELIKTKVSVNGEKNTISSAQINLKEIADNFKRQQEIVKQLSMKMGDLVAAKDIDNNKVEFNDKNTGLPVFQDQGNHVVMSDKKPDIEHVSVAMTFAAEKFGKVDINGTKEFKQQVIDVAVAKDLNIVFADKKMQEQFIKDKEAFKESQSNENTITNKETLKQEPVLSTAKLLEHGTAPYNNDKNNADSYYIKTSDGRTHWGVGLRDAVEKSKANIGDEITIKRLGTEKVEVPVDIKDDQGNVVDSKMQAAERVKWEIKKAQTDKIDEQKKQEQTTTTDTTILKGTVKEEKPLQLNVAYNWSEKDKKMEVTVNGKSPKDIPVEVMTNIKNNDKFLKSYSIENIREGKLDLSKSNTQPIPKAYDMEGMPKQIEETTKTIKQTQ